MLDIARNNRFIILLILIFFLTPIKNSYPSNFILEDQIEPYCNGVGPDNFLKDIKIDNIEIRAHKSKKWTKNLLGVLVDFNSKDSKTHNEGIFNFRIANKYKKKFKSSVIVNFKEKNLSCIFEAKIRITGLVQGVFYRDSARNTATKFNLHVKLCCCGL